MCYQFYSKIFLDLAHKQFRRGRQLNSRKQNSAVKRQKEQFIISIKGSWFIKHDHWIKKGVIKIHQKGLKVSTVAKMFTEISRAVINVPSSSRLFPRTTKRILPWGNYIVKNAIYSNFLREIIKWRQASWPITNIMNSSWEVSWRLLTRERDLSYKITEPANRPIYDYRLPTSRDLFNLLLSWHEITLLVNIGLIVVAPYLFEYFLLINGHKTKERSLWLIGILGLHVTS